MRANRAINDGAKGVGRATPEPDHGAASASSDGLSPLYLCSFALPQLPISNRCSGPEISRAPERTPKVVGHIPPIARNAAFASSPPRGKIAVMIYAEC
jgi:hypothetical protein